MNRLVLAGSVLLGTFVLGIFAVALAQRDSRTRGSIKTPAHPEYAKQKPAPLMGAEGNFGDGRVFSHAKPSVGDPLSVPPPLSSQSIVRGNDASVSISANGLGAESAEAIGVESTEMESGMGDRSSLDPSQLGSANVSDEPERLLQPTQRLIETIDQATQASGMSMVGYSAGSDEGNVGSGLRPMGAQQPLAPPPLAPGRGSLNPPSLQPPALNPPSLQSAPGSTMAPIMAPPALGGATSNVNPGMSSGMASPARPLASPTSGGSQANGLSNPMGGPAPVGGSAIVPRGEMTAPGSSGLNPPSLTPPSLANPNTNANANGGLPQPAPMAAPPASPAMNTASQPGLSPLNGARPNGAGMRAEQPPVGTGTRSPQSESATGVGERRPARDDWSANTALVNETPGQRLLDGAQNPSLQLQKRAPEEVQVGQPAVFTLVLRNVGNATAHEVTVLDRVPRGTRMTRTSPPANTDGAGALIWNLGEMTAGAEQILTVELIPEMEGEIGSVASVTFASQASVRSVSTQPKLEVTQYSENKVLVGEPVNLRMQVTNVGTGVARDVWLEEEVPQGLRHPQGAKLELSLGDLAPGESRSIPLELIATEPGVVQNVVRAVAANLSPIDSVGDVEVIAPQLVLAVNSPRMRYLERQFTYQVSITNRGTATARDVEMIGYLPKGLQFNNAGNHGEYLSEQHAAVWALEELAPGETATTELTVLPVEDGEYVFRMQGSADGVRADAVERPIRIEGQSELSFTIDDDNDPIETDEQTTYTIAISNIGTRSDSQVELAVALPAGSQVVQVQAPVRYQTTAEGIVFEPIPEMRSKDRQVFRMVVRLPREGMQVARASVKSRLRPVGESKEESTQVYSDR